MKYVLFLTWAIAQFLCASTLHAKSGQLKLGLNPWAGYEFIFLAQEIGCYKKHKLDIRLVEYSALADMANAYERGQIEGMATNAVDAYYAHLRMPTRPLQTLMAIDYSNGADMIIAAPLDGNSMYSLKGKRVGVEVMSLGVFVLSRALQKSGLSIHDVTMVPLAQTQMESAMTAKSVDAIVTYPPFSIKSASQSGRKILFSSKDIPGEILDILVISERWVKDNGNDQMLADIVRCFYDAVDYRTAFPDAADKIMAKREGITVAEFREALAGMIVFTPNEFKKTIGDGKPLVETLKNIEAALKDEKTPTISWDIAKFLAPIAKFQVPLSK